MILYAAETILYFAFMGMDFFGIGNTVPLKFLSILLLTLSALDLRERTVTLALVFTACADVFLLVLDRYYAAGILCFIAVQCLYAMRLSRSGRCWDGSSVFTPGVPDWLKFIVSAAAGLAACTSYGFGLTEGLAAAYIALFACNLVHACRLAAYIKERKWILFAAGLALFFCCDLCVGLHNMPGAGGPALQRFADLAMWGFYLPGQVLIRASAYTGTSGPRGAKEEMK